MNNQTITVAIVGARGHVGYELIALIDQHPVAELTAVYSRAYQGQLVKDKVAGFSDQSLAYGVDYVADFRQQTPDVIFLALPNGVAKANGVLWQSLSEKCCIIDLSADFRFAQQWQYGQPETRQQQVIGQSLIANPGCYATAMQLGVFPILDYVVGDIYAFGVSGYSGAGSKPCDKNDPKKLTENLMAYQLMDHIHEREVSHVLGCQVRFVPHVASFFRGIHMTLTCTLRQSLSIAQVRQQFKRCYHDHQLIQVFDQIPEVKAVRNKHEVHIGGFAVKGRQVVLCVVIDNLLKGAATQAIQNMNLALSQRCSLSINTGVVSPINEVKI